MLKCPHCRKAISDKIVVAHAGRVGGKKTAERGSDYFRWLQSRRKRRKGGRPKRSRDLKQ